MRKYLFIFLLLSIGANAQDKLNVYFDFDKYELTEDAVKKINSWIAEGKNYQVTKLYGFCDWKGTNLYNDTLALKRVNEVYRFLKESDIEVKKDIEIRGFGEDFEQSKIQGENRRVTIMYQVKSEVVLESKPAIVKLPLKEKIKKAHVGDVIVLENIYFWNHSARTVPKSETTLYDLWCAMVDNPKLRIEIHGHICCMPPDKKEVISIARARAVYNYLIRKKVNRDRISFRGFGATRPIYPIPEKNALEQEENRRVEILIVEN